MSRAATSFVAGLVFASLAPTAGCSVVFVRRPKTVAPAGLEAGNCTTSRVLPAIDIVLAGVQASNAIYLLGKDNPDENAAEANDAVLRLSAAMAAAFVTSAVYGFGATARCRELRREAENPYKQPTIKQTRGERQSEEAAEEAAVQARIQERAAADAKAAGEAAQRALPPPPAPAPAKAP